VLGGCAHVRDQDHLTLHRQIYVILNGWKNYQILHDFLYGIAWSYRVLSLMAITVVLNFSWYSCLTLFRCSICNFECFCSASVCFGLLAFFPTLSLRLQTSLTIYSITVDKEQCIKKCWINWPAFNKGKDLKKNLKTDKSKNWTINYFGGQNQSVSQKTDKIVR
jgi:hypothetical protein